MTERYRYLLSHGKNEIEAMGLLMAKYGSLEKAGLFSGFTEEEIASWNLAEYVVDKRSFCRFFRD